MELFEEKFKALKASYERLIDWIDTRDQVFTDHLEREYGTDAKNRTINFG
jgi:hypothetical protein